MCASSQFPSTTYLKENPFKRLSYATAWGWNTHAGFDSSTYLVTSGASLGGYAGEWLKLSLPYGVKLSGYQIMIRGVWAAYGPDNWVIMGSNDDKSWNLLASVTSGGITSNGQNAAVTKNFVVETTKYYKHLALVCSKTVGVSALNVAGLRYFGTREQGASTLHNGELSLTRNLTVPRIGPPLDADDTPRRDRLVVEYNTSTNPVENSVVKDTSGRGLDGLLDNTYGGAAYNPYYDATEKALVFDGSNDYVFQNDVHLKTGVGGVYSASVWVRNRASTGTHTVYSLGTYAQLTTSTLYVLDTTLQVVFYNSDLDVTYTIPKNTWTNIVVTHGGGQTSTTTKMYINGVDVGLTAASGTSFPLSTVNFPSPCNLFLGKNSDNSVYGGPMDLSNFKLWDTELSAEDAKQLYDMGRCDEGHHVVNFSKTRVGIGLGDGEAPSAALDVRGDIYGGCPVYFAADSTAYRYASSSGAIIIFDHVEVERGGGYDRTTGIFTAPLSGVYKFVFYARQEGSQLIYARMQLNGSSQGHGRAYMHTSYVMGGCTSMYRLNVGDTVSVKLWNSSSGRISSSYNGFIGQYISSL